MASNERNSIWGFVKNTAQKAKTASDNARLNHLKNQVDATLANASSHQDVPEIQEIVSKIPGDWNTYDLPALKSLTGEFLNELNIEIQRANTAKEQIEREIAAQDERDKRFAEVIGLLNDDAALATFNAGAAMDEDDHRNFKGVLKSQAPSGDGFNDTAMNAGISEIANHRFPDTVTYACIVGKMIDSDRQLLRVAAILMRHNVINRIWFEKAFAGIVFEAGGHRIYECTKEGKSRGLLKNLSEQMTAVAKQTLNSSLGTYLFSSNILQQEMVALATKLQRESPNSPVVQELASAAGGGANWFNSADTLSSIYELEPGKGLFLGQLDDGGFLHYDGEGSLFTIAPPGSGKTQCQVLPNLVMYDGPAIVLDVKGECYEQTAGNRSQAFGPVIRFAPSDWDNSCHYNPLDFVRSDQRHLASDARKLADMLILPEATGDKYWEQRGRDILAALIGYVAFVGDEGQKTMKTVMDLLSPSPDSLDNLIQELRSTSVSYLERAANQIDGMSEKQLSSIFDSARSQLSVWDLGELDPITDRSDWHPRDFKTAGRPLTLYICVGPADIGRFASILRVIIGQHLDYFMEVLPENVEKPIVFFLDEAPQLGSFEPLPKASALGRQYGLRLWLFAQNRNQIETAYMSADTILGNAVVQCWMNPDETSAHALERNLGTTRSLFDGSERPLAKSHELRGPDYKDVIITIGRGEKPAKLAKHFAFNDDSIASKLGLPVST